MKNILNTFFVVILMSFCSIQAQNDSTRDPRVGLVPYYGIGESERSPEYGDVRFSFSVSCQSSPAAVFQSIQKVSGNIWNTIISNVSPDKESETECTYWGDVTNVVAYDPTTMEGDGKSSVVRRNSCTNKQVGINEKVPLVYRGDQMIGVKTSKLDWLEALVSAVKNMEQDQSNDPAVVKINEIPILYAVTKNTQAEMRAEVEKKAAEEAIGPGSAFDADRKALNFKDAYFVARHPAFYVPTLGEEIGSPVLSGEAPRVSLKVKMRYGLQIETSNLLNDGADKKSDSAQAQYEEVGEAQAVADYAETDIIVNTQCHKTQKEALDAVGSKFNQALALVKNFQGNKPSTGTDQYSYGEIDASQFNPLEPATYEGEGPNRVIAKYFDSCTSELVSDAEYKANPSARIYYQAHQSISMRSSNFAELSHLRETLLALNEAAPGWNASQVTVSTPVGKITEETKAKLMVQARKLADLSLVDQNSTLNKEARNRGRFGFRNAYLTSIGISQNVQQPVYGGRALPKSVGAMPAAADSSNSNSIDLSVQYRDNQTRPTISLKQTLQFDMKILTDDLIGPAKTTPTN